LREKDIYDIKKPTAKNFERCLQIQEIRAVSAVTAILHSYFESASSDISKSEIISALKAIGDSVVPQLNGQKVVLVISDMLENSHITSFYSKGDVRKIEPAAELGKVVSKQLTTDFGGADVYVIGAGVLPSDQKGTSGSYRDQATMGALREFWKSYLEKSNGVLKGFGQPLLLAPIKAL
jgi:hypothetical protein